MPLILAASIVYSYVTEPRPVRRDLLIGLFLTVPTPVTPILLGRATAYRDRIELSACSPSDL
jgi:multisubunit Na+/H+ antiporter MnhG subunit